ncbi:hypothetical protein EV122DRAFT_284985 [Schizophyllum commune]
MEESALYNLYLDVADRLHVPGNRKMTLNLALSLLKPSEPSAWPHPCEACLPRGWDESMRKFWSSFAHSFVEEYRKHRQQNRQRLGGNVLFLPDDGKQMMQNIEALLFQQRREQSDAINTFLDYSPYAPQRLFSLPPMSPMGFIEFARGFRRTSVAALSDVCAFMVSAYIPGAASFFGTIADRGFDLDTDDLGAHLTFLREWVVTMRAKTSACEDERSLRAYATYRVHAERAILDICHGIFHVIDDLGDEDLLDDIRTFLRRLSSAKIVAFLREGEYVCEQITDALLYVTDNMKRDPTYDDTTDKESLLYPLQLNKKEYDRLARQGIARARRSMANKSSGARTRAPTQEEGAFIEYVVLRLAFLWPFNVLDKAGLARHSDVPRRDRIRLELADLTTALTRAHHLALLMKRVMRTHSALTNLWEFFDAALGHTHPALRDTSFLDMYHEALDSDYPQVAPRYSLYRDMPSLPSCNYW